VVAPAPLVDLVAPAADMAHAVAFPFHTLEVEAKVNISVCLNTYGVIFNESYAA
jgi:hypothetical protein